VFTTFLCLCQTETGMRGHSVHNLSMSLPGQTGRRRHSIVFTTLLCLCQTETGMRRHSVHNLSMSLPGQTGRRRHSIVFTTYLFIRPSTQFVSITKLVNTIF